MAGKSNRNDRDANAKSRSKGFFALDVHQFERIRQTGLGVEEVAAYLCLLKSTNHSNVVSCGGVRSIMDYSGLSRAEAKRAIRNLDAKGLVECLDVERARARRTDRYNLPIHDTRRSLSPKEKAVVGIVGTGQQPSGQSDIQAAHRAGSKGWIEKRSDGWQVIEHCNAVAFMPNSFVQVSEGRSPLYRLMNGGEIGPIILAAELYQLQNLIDERGVPLGAIRGYFHTKYEKRQGRHRIHHLYPGRPYTDEKSGTETSFAKSREPAAFRDYENETFWHNLDVLDKAHVTEWAVYSANGQPSGAYDFNRPQRPLGVLRNSKQVLTTPESRPAFMAYLVGRLQEAGGQVTESLPELIEQWRTDSPIVAFENASVSHVEGISILRLTHRAATENAAVWYRDLCKECDQAFFFIEQAAMSYFPQISDIVREIKTMADWKSAISMKINVSSM